MKPSLVNKLLLSLLLSSMPLLAADPVRAFNDDTQPGFRDLKAEDFTQVNSADTAPASP